MHSQAALLLVLSQLPARGPAYRISARLDEVTGTLTARAEIVVRNATAAPVDTLRLVVPSSVHLDQLTIGDIQPPFAMAGSLLTLPLPRRLAPGDSITLIATWTARPNRRDGREFAFGSWQLRAGDFGDVRVLLDVPADQVVSGTGTAVCGEPGWNEQEFQSDRVVFGGTPMPSPVARRSSCRASASGADRKVMEWHAENVAEVALVLSPAFQHEAGDVLRIPVRAFYPAGDAYAWGAGAATSHLEAALAWLDEVFGPYPWPQASIVRTTGAADTVVPMQLWGANADQLHVMRELGRMYTGRMVSVSDPADAWLEEALARFQATWYLEEEGLRSPVAQLEREVLMWDLDGTSRPIAQPRSAFTDSATASAMIVRRGEFFLHQLRALVGDSVMRAALHDYFAQHRFKSVNAMTLQTTLERVARRDLSDFFTQWLHRTDLIDYSVTSATRQRTDSGWRTDVRIDAHAPGRFPVALWVLTNVDTVAAISKGRDAREQFSVRTRGRPDLVVLDPEGKSHDWNPLNNQHTFGLILGRDRPTDYYIDSYFGSHSARDRVTIGLALIAWRTDRDGWSIGVRRRDNYLDRFELNEFTLAASTGWGVRTNRVVPQASLQLRNPIGLRITGWNQRLGVFRLDGRSGAALAIERSRRGSVARPARQAFSLDLAWLKVQTPAYVDSLVYDDAGTVELTATTRGDFRSRVGVTRFALAVTGGYQYPSAGATSTVARAAYGRVTAVLTARSDPAARLRIGLRLYGGASFSSADVVKQRGIYLAGADPYERMSSPFLRSRGALLARGDVRYHAPGGAGMRGLDPRLFANQAYGASLEADASLWRRHSSLARRASIAVFADGALADGGFSGGSSAALQSVAEAGAGLRLDHRFGATDFQTRWDFPLWISRPALAQDRRPGARQGAWRWVFSFTPPF